MNGVSVEALTQFGYAFVFAWVLAEQIGLPIPAVPVLLAAGALAGSDRLSLALVVTIAAIASLASDLIWYWIGRAQRTRVLGWLCRITFEPDSCVRRTEQVFAAHGARSLLIAKFVPGFSTAAPPLAGVVRMPLLQFVVFTGLGGVIWAGTFAGLGWLFSAELELVADYVAYLGRWTGALLAALLGTYIGWRFIARQRFLRRIRTAQITPEELKAMLDEHADVLVVDVRDRLDFDAEPSIIPGAMHLTTEDLRAGQHEIPRERDIVVYCT
jgi:membrane protein DedA with SNARE-associated domain